MAASTVIEFDELFGCDLLIDAVYRGGTNGNASDDPIARIVPVGNQGGFRRKTRSGHTVVAVLYTSGASTDWPDHLDFQLGEYTYFGDNRTPGRELHDTPKGGNSLLRDSFASAAASAGSRAAVPPFLVFEKAEAGRDVRFRGIAVPGSATTPLTESLVAVWRSREDQRFQNYRATFTILDVATVPRVWLDELLDGEPLGAHAPEAWRDWISTGQPRPLISEPAVTYRSKAEQLPSTDADRAMLGAITSRYSEDPWGFEACALHVWRMLAPATGQADLTRRWRDGGRDAVGHYLIGPSSDPVPVEFALEAKCYALTNGVGVRETSRLVSRLRHRQFGVFVTTSYFGQQAYEEIRADQHPVALISGRDIVDALRSVGVTSVAMTETWLNGVAADPV
ncbi:restriction endonuclease [Dermatobacter hominis]|uniref:restriction endonuclease n=1 Tax=Dermatobacter hominis TaxID=2884263 RepID=UPI001D123743|nr:restriction endonuclease [Dermatobacter hominis]UDY34893.1 restriction endonuclease [Dermatobacter hominis]